MSAKDTHRPELQNLIEFAREGDTVYVHDFSSLARSTKDLLSLVESFYNKGVIPISNKENIDTSTSMGQLMYITTLHIIPHKIKRANTLDNFKIKKLCKSRYRYNKVYLS